MDGCFNSVSPARAIKSPGPDPPTAVKLANVPVGGAEGDDVCRVLHKMLVVCLSYIYSVGLEILLTGNWFPQEPKPPNWS